jgi:hypothetical protein
MFINIQFISAHYSENGDQAVQDSGRIPPKFKTILPLLLGHSNTCIQSVDKCLVSNRGKTKYTSFILCCIHVVV